MTKRMARRIPEPGVGYGRPPKRTRFKPGKSGNPKGRPKGSRSLGAMLHDVIRQKVPVTDGGKTKRVAVLDIVFRRLANDAMRSDPRAIKLLLSLLERHAEVDNREAEIRDLSAEDSQILARYLRSQNKD